MTPFFGKNSPKSPFFYDNTLLEKVRPAPPFEKNSKKISVFSDKEISDSARPLPPPFGVFLKKKKNSFFYASPKERHLKKKNYFKRV